MGAYVNGLLMSGGRIVGRETFSSIPGLAMDLDSASRVVLSGSTVISWTDRVSGMRFVSHPSGQAAVKSGDYIVLDAATLICNFVPIDLKFLYNASCRGIYILGEITGGGVTRTLLQTIGSNGNSQGLYRTINSSGNSRLGYTSMLTTTFTAASNLAHDEKKCWSFVFGENNTTNNAKLYQGSSLLGQTTRNYTSNPSAMGITARIQIGSSTAGRALKIQRLLVYDWSAYDNVNVSTFHGRIKDVFNKTYGSIF